MCRPAAAPVFRAERSSFRSRCRPTACLRGSKWRRSRSCIRRSPRNIPEIKTYRGRGLDDPRGHARARCHARGDARANPHRRWRDLHRSVLSRQRPDLRQLLQGRRFSQRPQRNRFYCETPGEDALGIVNQIKGACAPNLFRHAASHLSARLRGKRRIHHNHRRHGRLRPGGSRHGDQPRQRDLRSRTRHPSRPDRQ